MKGNKKMAIQFAKDEKVLKSFNYASIGYNKKKGQFDTFKKLTVTNKRIIHETVRETRSDELILRQEMPVTDAKYIKTTMGKTANPKFLVLAIVFGVFALTSVVLSFLKFAESIKPVFFAIAAVFAVVAIVNLVSYLKSRVTAVTFSIFTDKPVMLAMSTAVADGDFNQAQEAKQGNKEPTVEIRVSVEDAREIADGLGAAILNAANYIEEAPLEEVAEAVPAFAEAEEAPAEIPAAEVIEEA
jgi:hypothetical protein